ncbi:DUF3311 domain-containing protein [Pararhizobium qamdonense]|uniref:DUF3311 domain-containing protein n=1 Tax=Pararhizobium qamdonense TaxID=3031126 RepID=UPI0023E13766|nr:DUF3311 domain-containing protein [Pararhizobium qamdonense]
MKYAAPIILVTLVFVGSVVCNRVTPLVFGLPMFFAWHLFSVFMMSAGMWIIFKLDPQNRLAGPETERNLDT